jgi:DASS family divalent anion:Na+ symporter
MGASIVPSISEYVSGSSGGNKTSIGGYLSLVYSQTNAVCSAMFLTGMISNAIVCEIAGRNGVHLTWWRWICFSAIPCLLIVLIIPLINYIVFLPKTGRIAPINKMDNEVMQKLGPITNKEKITICTFAFMLIFWILSDIIHVDVMTTTLIGLCVLILSGVLSIDVVLSNHKAWSSILMVGILFSYVNCLTELGVIKCGNEYIQGIMHSVPENLRYCFLSVAYFFSRYFFSGEGVMILAMFSSFFSIGIGLGLDKFTLAMTLGIFSSISCVVAHYASPMAISMFNLGYSSSTKWMISGLLTSVAAILIVLLFATFLMPF